MRFTHFAIIWRLIFVAFLGNALLPDAARSEPVHITLSAKTWINRFEIRFDGDSLDSSFNPMIELTVSLRKNQVFTGIKLAKGSMTFDRGRICRGSVCENVSSGGIIDISQMEVALGYYVKPWLGPYVAYFNQTQEFDFTTSSQITGNQSVGAGMIGLIFGFPSRRRRDVFYGKVGFVGLGAADLEGSLLEAGIAYLLKTLPITLSAGVKYQKLTYSESSLNIGQQNRSEDVLLGINAGIHYSIR